MQKTNIFLKSLKHTINGKKVRCVPLIFDNNRYVTYFKEKCQYFNARYFGQSTLSKNIGTVYNTCSKYTNKTVDIIVSLIEYIYKIIKAPGQN